MVNKEGFSLRDWLETNGPKGVLFDLDDTLTKTHKMFARAASEVTDLYAVALPSLEPIEISRILSEVKLAAYRAVGVGPDIWDTAVDLFEKKVDLKKSLEKEALEIFASIYTEEPEFEEGAEEILELLRQWKLKVGLVTHANVEWTLFKLKSLGLEEFFDHVEIVDEKRLYKNGDDWKNGANGILLPPSKILVVGDSIKGDIQTTVEAKFGKVVWINNRDGWNHFSEGELPSGVVEIERVGELLNLKDE